MARCLKPGGSLIIVDFTQPEADGPDACTFHTLPSSHTAGTTAALPASSTSSNRGTSPYSAYMHTDLEYALIKAGLYVGEREVNWVSKVLKATKPGVSAQTAPRRATSTNSNGSGSSSGRVSSSSSSNSSNSSRSATAVAASKSRGSANGRVVTRQGGSPRGEGELYGVGY
jgi:hypothetical protein